jgi:hypothetical protein
MPVASSTTVTFRDADILAGQKYKGSRTSLSSGESSETSLVRRRPGNGSNKEKEVSTVQEYPEPRPRKRQRVAAKTVVSFTFCDYWCMLHYVPSIFYMTDHKMQLVKMHCAFTKVADILTVLKVCMIC